MYRGEPSVGKIFHHAIHVAPKIFLVLFIEILLNVLVYMEAMILLPVRISLLVITTSCLLTFIVGGWYIIFHVLENPPRYAQPYLRMRQAIAIRKLLKRQEEKTSYSTQLLQLDTKLFHLLTVTAPCTHKEEFFSCVLKYTLTVFGDNALRSNILLPAKEERDYLTIFAQYPVVKSSERKKFYIGADSVLAAKRGIGGEAFCHAVVMVAHLSFKDGKVRSDRPSYIQYSATDDCMEYSAFACVPLIAASNPGKVLGVMCLNSKDKDMFDPQEVQHLLKLVGSRIADILMFYNSYVFPILAV